MDRKKRRIKNYIIAVCMVLGIVVSYYTATISLAGSPVRGSEASNQITKKLELALKQTAITVEVGEEIPYLNYIKTAAIDGEPAIEYVSFTSADTSKVGSYRIKYVLEADNQTRTHVYLMVNVIEAKEKEEEKKEDTSKQEAEKETSAPVQSDEKEESSAASQPANDQVANLPPSSNESSSVQTPSVSQPVKAPYTQNFLFSDGYDMSNVENSCAAAGEASGMSWACIPLTKEDGIFIGMQLQTSN